MIRFKQHLKPTLFEKQVLRNNRALIAFFCALVPFISGFNIYCTVTERFFASTTLTIQLILFTIVLCIFRPPTTDNQKILAIRYVIRAQLIIFAGYMILVVGIQHQLEVTPWAFLFIFLLFLLFPDKKGGLFSFLFVSLMLFFMLWTDLGKFKVHEDYLIRFYFSLSLFSFLTFCTVILRDIYLRNLEKTKKDLKKSEMAYRKLNANLITEIKYRDKIEKKLHQSIKMETLGNIAAGVAHDLNNILSGIATYPDLLLLNMAKDDPKRKHTEMIRDSGFKAAAIVEDLLTLARRGICNLDETDLKQVIETYLSSLEHETFLKNHPDIVVQTYFSPDVLKIMGSSIHLSKALMNLILNAGEAMPRGGNIQIRLFDQYTKTIPALFDDIPEGQYTVMSIKDSGIGIEASNLENIFEPFYSNKKMGQSGTGLGMAIVMGTIKDHHAFIDIESIVGKQTCITLYFPVANKEPEQSISKTI